jgi:Na+/H+ antiporter NhaD/arsenite permease-like protein
MLFVSSVLLGIFYVIDRLAWKREPPEIEGKKSVTRQLRIDGLHNVLYLLAVALTVLASGFWNRGAMLPIGLGIEMPVNGLVRDAILIAVALLSWKTTKQSIRVENAFTWAPMQEVAMLFAAIFVFMGALTYIGNAPNFMVRSICEERGVRMPSFIGYMAWSGVILLPLFAAVTLIWFR